MRKLICSLLLCVGLSVIVSAQSDARFPGISSPMHLQILGNAKMVTAIPLPTWLPNGFKLEKVDVHLGSKVPIEKKRLTIIYSRRLSDGKTQRFALDAGFEGLGDLPYDTTKSVRSAIGQIDIAYEPPDLDGNGTKTENFVMTQWFTVGKTAFHYDGMYGAKPNEKRLTMISLADTVKILASLKRF